MFDPPREKEPVDYTGLKIGAIVAPVFFLVTYLSNADTGLAACIVLGLNHLSDQNSLAFEETFLVLGGYRFHIGAPNPISSLVQSAAGKYAYAFLYDAARNRGFSDHLGALGIAEKLFLKNASADAED